MRLRLWLALLLSLVLLPAAAEAQVSTSPCISPPLRLHTFADESISVGASATVFLTAANVLKSPAMVAISNTGTNTILYRVTGNGATNPSVGGLAHHLAAATEIFVCGAHAASAISFIAISGGVSSIFATYYQVQ